MRHRLYFLSILLTVTLLTGAALAWLHNVPTAVTDEDAHYLRLIFARQGEDPVLKRRPVSYSEEIDTILAVQRTILGYAPENKGIPFDVEREPRALFEARFGLCYDRGRAIEKALSLIGFETRHIAVYETDTTGSALRSLLTPEVRSHAVSEIRTSKGWIVVDANEPWISLTSDNKPISMARLHEMAGNREPGAWTVRNKAKINFIFVRNFTYVIGLYSRHGKFYAPFTPVPDVNWKHLAANLG